MKKSDITVITQDGAPLEEQFYYAFIHGDEQRADAILDRIGKTTPQLSRVDGSMAPTKGLNYTPNRN